MHLAKGKKHLVIELKQTGNLYSGLEEKVAELINKYGMLNQVTIISFDHQSIKRMKEIEKSVEVGLLFYGRPMMLAEQIDHIGASHLSIYHGFITEELVESLKNHRVQIGTWTVNDLKSAERIKSISKDILITTNHPELIMEKKKTSVHV